jgi:uncharacterized protein (TIGR04255 family)
MDVTFNDPPLEEVIVGAYFAERINALRSEHVGLFWSKIRKQLPVIEQQTELPSPVGAMDSFGLPGFGELYPMPRFWLTSEDQSFLIQIQKNAFLFNWRNRNKEYPRFNEVKAKFDHYYAVFSDFVSGELHTELPPIQATELTYSNLVGDSPRWSRAQDTSSVIPGFSIPNVGEGAQGTIDFNQVTAYSLQPNLVLNVAIRTARKATDASVPVLIIDLRAIGALGAASKMETDSWYEQAHETIIRAFTAMTAEDIQRDHWQRA